MAEDTLDLDALVAEACQREHWNKCWGARLEGDAKAFVERLAKAVDGGAQPPLSKVAKLMRDRFDVHVSPKGVGDHITRRTCSCWQ